MFVCCMAFSHSERPYWVAFHPRTDEPIHKFDPSQVCRLCQDFFGRSIGHASSFIYMYMYIHVLQSTKAIVPQMSVVRNGISEIQIRFTGLSNLTAPANCEMKRCRLPQSSKGRVLCGRFSTVLNKIFLVVICWSECVSWQQCFLHQSHFLSAKIGAIHLACWMKAMMQAYISMKERDTRD